ncbi:MAG TPA: DnaA N-terminal domain-containing protein [Tissierellaceae bacterium]|nr:DnaA N-terminal domain-containing protein [Tissierellaceae bacterium]
MSNFNILEEKRQNIISLVNKMDEDELDKLLYSIEFNRINKSRKMIISSEDAKIIWEEASIAMKNELTEATYNTWINTIIPVSIEGDVFTLAVQNEFTLGIVEQRYSKLIYNALFYITDKKFKLEYIVKK